MEEQTETGASLMTESQGEEIIALLTQALDYLDAINQVVVSVQSYTMLIFWVLSLTGGIFIGRAIWGR